MGDTNLHLGDIKIKNADTGQEIKINGPLKLNFDNKNLFDSDDYVDSCTYSFENCIKTGDISLTGSTATSYEPYGAPLSPEYPRELYQQNTTLTDYAVTNATFDIWNRLDNLENKKENKNMRILDIYRERQREFIQESFDVTKEDLIMQDPFTKLYEKFQTDMKKLYKKENNEELKYNFILGENFLTKETREAIEKADEEKVFEIENLEELIEEVEALLDMTDDYDKQIEILKKYDILNEEGMLNA